MTNLVSSVIRSLEVSSVCETEQERRKAMEKLESEAISSFGSMVSYFFGAIVIVLILKCFI